VAFPKTLVAGRIPQLPVSIELSQAHLHLKTENSIITLAYASSFRASFLRYGN